MPLRPERALRERQGVRQDGLRLRKQPGVAALRQCVRLIRTSGRLIRALTGICTDYDSGKSKAVGSHVLNERDVARHAARRRVWARAFSPQALHAYEVDVLRRAGMLVDALDALLPRSQQLGVAEVDVSPWIARFSCAPNRELHAPASRLRAGSTSWAISRQWHANALYGRLTD